jgi:two-component system, response regulator, stage 0 sporulation protein F
MTKRVSVHLLKMILEGAGYEVVEAANGRQGLTRYRHRPTDLIITDLAMPDVNGLDMIMELTREFLDAKVIAMSGVGGDDNDCCRKAPKGSPYL